MTPKVALEIGAFTPVLDQVIERLHLNFIRSSRAIEQISIFMYKTRIVLLNAEILPCLQPNLYRIRCLVKGH